MSYRTGALFSFMHHPGLVPDVVTTSKSFGGGKASISGYIAREPIARAAYDNLADATLHSTTYYGFGEETATALEAVAVAVEEDFSGRALELGERLGEGLSRVAARHPKLVRRVEGRGALHGVFLTPGPQLPAGLRQKLPTTAGKDPQAVSKLLTAAVIAALYRDHGILTFFGSNRLIALIVSPPLVARDDEADLFVNALDEVLDQGASRLLAGLVREKVAG
ncbi:aminotransferase class III-fold pyridoxal phosphate-dependent enzyme [Streptomyces sp. NPDC044780]|uniref:aminotransferase class III-fold pyridoxal phosphate-dependent enzyme n=1 Tax=unclassified Streptomyces TaxID=2593676 RepID=UPI0033DA3E68